MKQLIFKTIAFTLPFFILFILTELFYLKSKGDLYRLGYFSKDYEYDSSKLFKKEIERKKRFTHISELDFKKNNSFDILNVGDSFSELGPYSYQDYLTEYSKRSLLNFDRFLHDNPLETVNSLANSDFFEKVKIKYVILQTVERAFIERAQKTPRNNILTYDSIIKKIQENKLIEEKKSKKIKERVQFFSNNLIRFPLYNLFYNVSDNAFFSPTYKVLSLKKLFSAQGNNILFFKEDLQFAKNIGKNIDILNSNNEINKLQEKLNKKGIKLILLICPDKYDVYYNYFIDKIKYPKPTFFDVYNKLSKKYIYIKSKELISQLAKNQKDVYYFDDTHWSPIAAKRIAKEINETINSTER